MALSAARLERRGTAAAVEAAEEALRLATDRVGPDLAAIAHSQLAMIHGRSGHPHRALEELDLAVAGGAGMPPRDRFVVLLSRGMVRMDLGDAAGAAGDFDDAAALAAGHGLARQEFMARHNRGCAAQLAGDLPRALRLMLEADALPVDISRAVAWQDRGRVLVEAGLVTEAAELLEQAAELCRDRGQRQVRAEIDLELARALILLGEPSAALARARRARQVFERRGTPGWVRRAELVVLAARLRHERSSPSLAEDALLLASTMEEAGDAHAALVARLVAAEAFSRARDGDRAVELVRQLAVKVPTGGLETRLRYRRVAAVTATGRGDRRTAARHLHAAAADLHRSRAVSSSLDLRAAVTLHAGPLAQLDLETARPAGAGAVLVALERWRSTVAETPVVRPPADPHLAARVVGLRQARRELAEQPERDDVRRRVRSLESEVASLLWSSGGAGPGEGGPRTDAAHPRPAEVVSRARSELRVRDTDLVGYVRGGGRLGAVVVHRGRARLHDLGPDADVDEGVRRLSADLTALASVADGPLARAVRRSLDASLDWCAARLLAPLGLGDRVLVLPCDGLDAVPWGMVPGRTGLPTTVAPSLASWLGGTSLVAAPTVLAVAGPELTWAQREVERVAATWSVAPTLGPATAEDLRSALEKHDVVHVAAHGTHHVESPVFSSVWMADGPLFLCDLERTAITSSHVVISACEAGQSRRRGASHHLGLATGLLTLGVGSVVASPCRVPDATAAEVMGRYHEHLRSGEESADALALAASASDGALAGAFQALGAPWRAGGA